MLTRPAHGPKRLFFYNLFESDVTGAPLSVRNRPGGSIDAYAAAVGRWLVTRDAFDFLVFYLSDYDYASHVQGPDAAHAALARCDDAVGGLIEAAGGADEFLERYAVILCSDHGQTQVDEVERLEDTFPEATVTASNRAGMVYSDGDPAALAARLDGHRGVDVVLYREGEEAVARRDGEELRFTPDGTSGDAAILDHPQGLERAWAALANPNAGELIVSAAAGWEFADLAGRHHSGGGSHGSLLAGDSEVPMLTVGLETLPGSIVEVMPAVLEHFGVALPAYARTPAPRMRTGAGARRVPAAGAASRTTACSRRSPPSLASCSFPRICGFAPTTIARFRSVTARRSRSRSWSRRSAPRSSSTRTRACWTWAPARATRPRCWRRSRPRW